MVCQALELVGQGEIVKELGANAPDGYEKLSTKPISDEAVPKHAHSPTGEEVAHHKTMYISRTGANKDGNSIPDQDTGAMKRPTISQANTAVQTSIDYHKENKKAFDAIEDMKTPIEDMTKNDDGNHNEEALVGWREGNDRVDGSSGIERLKLKMKQDDDAANVRPVYEKKKLMAGYALHDPVNEALPASEPVLVPILDGPNKGRMVEQLMTPIVNLPDWTDCYPGPDYDMHKGFDLKQGLRDEEIETNVTLSECISACTKEKENCLGYLRVEGADDQNQDIKHSCLLIPKKVFELNKGPLNRTAMMPWRYGSLWLKDMTTADREENNCSTTLVPPKARVIPSTDFGPDAMPAPKPPNSVLAAIKAKAKKYYETAVNNLEIITQNTVSEKFNNNSVNISKTFYARHYEEQYVNERTAKATEKGAKVIELGQERVKKTKMRDALLERTKSERAHKAKTMIVERDEKSIRQNAAADKRKNERDYKKSPEGVLEAEQRDEQQRAVEKLKKEKQEEKQKEYDLSVQAAHKAELDRLEAQNVVISKALAAAKNGTANADQLTMLSENGIPYEEDLEGLLFQLGE